MEVLKVVEKSLDLPKILAPVPLLLQLQRKMKDYLDSVGGKDPNPVLTKVDKEQLEKSEAAKNVRDLWKLADKAWSGIKKKIETWEKDKKTKLEVELSRVQTFLNSPALKSFEDAWDAYPHTNAKTIDRTADEKKQFDDFGSGETLRLKNASDVEQAKKDIDELKKRFKREEVQALEKGAEPGLRGEMSSLKKTLTEQLETGKEKWLEARDSYQKLVVLLAQAKDEVTFREVRRENRESLGLRLDKLGKAIENLAAGTKLKKEVLEERKNGMRERLAKLTKLFDMNKLTSTWEPSEDDLREVVAVWKLVFECRSDSGEVVPPEPTITVQYSGKMEASKNKWKVWEDKINSIGVAFTTGLLEFSSTMQLTGNPGCRFHKQGDCWKFYLDEAEMGGSTTMRGWYRPAKVETGIQVTLVAISDSHSGPSEKVLYGEV